ncbi:MAG: hypothetical protein FWG58_04715 [Methanomassiliicoccaceae archaeon]|nr:hypothetical protein [Methanomassiliicoccaceae archaeon]
MFGFFKKKKEEWSGEALGTLAVGCGGGGCNMVNRLGKISDVDILTVNTDRKGLIRSRSNRRILLGDGSLEAGCNGDTELGASLAEEASEMIGEYVGRYLNVLILVGLGGGTGTGSVKVIADTAKRKGSRTTVIASLPMSFESERRRTAAEALDGIMRSSDTLVVMDGDRLAEIDPMLGVGEALSVLDQMICESFLDIKDMMEGDDAGSLFAMMKGRMFTVSFAEGMHAEKVADMLVSGLMMNAEVISRPIIFVRGNIPDGQERPISEKVSGSTGFEPVFVRGPSGQGMNLVMFAPIR